jgi:hypothetical protein
VPGAGTVHQHLNSGTRQSRYLALTGGSHGLVKPYGRSYGTGSKSMNEGGSQIGEKDEGEERAGVTEAHQGGFEVQWTPKWTPKPVRPHR